MREERYWTECGSSTPVSITVLLRAGRMVKRDVYPAEDGSLVPVITSGSLKLNLISPPEHITPSYVASTHLPPYTHICAA